MKRILVILAVALAYPAWASSTRSIDADALTSSDHSKTFTLPSQTGTLVNSVGYTQETPSGTINGSNTAFTLANTPGNAATLILTLDGAVLTQGSGKDYTVSGTSITFATAPVVGQIIWAVYSKN